MDNPASVATKIEDAVSSSTASKSSSSSSAMTPAAPTQTTEQKTALALQALASYFAQFAATRIADTNTGKLKEATGVNTLLWFTSLIGLTSAPKELQGLTASTEQSFVKAVQSFNDAVNILIPIAHERLSESAKSQYKNQLVQKLQDEADGDRFPKIFSTWLALFDQESLDATKAFIKTSQLILEQQYIDISLDNNSHAVFSVQLDATTTVYFHPLKTNSAKAISTRYIQDRIHASIFEGMETLAEKFAAARLKGTESAPAQNIAFSRLLSRIKREPTPTISEALRSIYVALDAYQKMQTALNAAAFAAGKGNNADANDFLLQCAILQTLILTIADENENVANTYHKHWTEYETVETKALIAQIGEKHSSAKPSFQQVLSELHDFSATFISEDGKTQYVLQFPRAALVTAITAYENREIGAETALLKLFISYVQALGMKLKGSIATYRHATEVTSVFNPDIALEYIATLKKYINSPEFEKSLNLSTTEAEFDVVDDSDGNDDFDGTFDKITTDNDRFDDEECDTSIIPNNTSPSQQPQTPPPPPALTGHPPVLKSAEAVASTASSSSSSGSSAGTASTVILSKKQKKALTKKERLADTTGAQASFPQSISSAVAASEAQKKNPTRTTQSSSGNKNKRK